MGRIIRSANIRQGGGPIDEIEAVRTRNELEVQVVSSSKSSFNYDFNVSFRASEKQAGTAVYNYRQFKSEGTEDLSGNSIFYKNPHGEVFHTYSTFGRGGEQFLGIYGFFDVLPRGGKNTDPLMDYRTGLDSRLATFTIARRTSPDNRSNSDIQRGGALCQSTMRFASLAVKDLKPASQWYERLFGRPPDSNHAEVVEWKFEAGRLAAGLSAAERPEMDL